MKNKVNHILEVNACDMGYAHGRKKIVVLRDLNLQVKRNELVCLIGRNGAGKTTLLNSIMRLQHLLSGEIRLNDQNIYSFQPNQFATIAGYVSTEMVRAEEMTIRELAELGRFPYTNWIGWLKEEDKHEVDKALNDVGLNHMPDHKINEISDGERQRAMIARTLAQNTKIIFLDEPFAFLDVPGKYEIAHLLRQLSNKGKSVIFSTHDLNLAFSYADKIWFIHEKNIIQGAPEDLILSGTMENFFNPGNVHFDPYSGNFEPVVEKRGCLGFINDLNDDQTGKWTVKALKRIGYDVVSPAGLESWILLLTRENDKIIWILQSNDQNLHFKNIYSLVQYLNHMNHAIN